MFLSIDIGGSSTKYAIISSEGQIVKRSSRIKDYNDLKEFIYHIKLIVEEAKDYGEILGVGISVPGAVDSEAGIVYKGGSLPFLDSFNFKKFFLDNYKLNCVIENDARCNVVGEFYKGELKNTKNSISLVIGTGIGCGIIINGKVYKGSNNSAGELSYVSFKNEVNTISDILGFDLSIVIFFNKVASLLGIDTTDGKELINYIKPENKEVWSLFEEYCVKLAKVIINLQYIFDYEKIVISGAISQQSIFIELVKEKVENLLEKNKITFVKPTVIGSKLNNQSNLYGAIYPLLEGGEKYGKNNANSK